MILFACAMCLGFNNNIRHHSLLHCHPVQPPENKIKISEIGCKGQLAKKIISDNSNQHDCWEDYNDT